MFPLMLADLTNPTWTDKELLIAIGSTLATVVTVAWGCVKWLTVSSRREARRLKLELQQTQQKLEQTQNVCQSTREQLNAERASDKVPRLLLDAAKQQITELEAARSTHVTELQLKIEQLTGNAQREIASLEKTLAEREGAVASEQRQAAHLEQTLAQLRHAEVELQQELRHERNRIKKAVQRDGHVWKDRVYASTSEGRPLNPEGRRTPVLSMLNLKGGVGKTTVTANLAAALDHLGYRVLMVDLDLQGSLSGLFLEASEQRRLYDEGLLLQDFLAASFDTESERQNLQNFIRPIKGERSGIVPTSDDLAYAEANLTIRWQLRDPNARDPRFLLRRELQLKRITDNYDIVLLDCPPLMNTCCVNALAASDYVIVPMMPSRQSTDRVPVLLERMKEVRANINPELKIMGLLANRTNNSHSLTSDETNRMNGLFDRCRDMWGVTIPLFEAFIPQKSEIRAVEDESRSLNASDEMFASFLTLAQEVQSRLPAFCRVTQPAAVEEAVA